MGGLDDRPPKIIMLNNKQSLKATLSQKAAEIGPATDISPVVSHARTTAAELPLTVTISIAVPLADAARYLEQLQQFLHAPNTAALPAKEPQQPPVNMQTPTATMQPAAAKPARIAPTAAPDQLSDKQKAMILNLSRRKKVAAEQMASLLKNRFGVDDEAMLSKRQASQLIDLLMAQ